MDLLSCIDSLLSTRCHLVKPPATGYGDTVTHEWFDPFERLATVLEAEMRTAAAAEGLRPVHLRLLWYLARCNRYSDTPSAAGEFLGLTKGTVSQSLGVLVRRRLVRRRRDRRDRRLVHLAPTAAGRRLITGLMPPQGWDVTDEGDAAAAKALRTLLERLQAARGLRTFGVCRSCRFFESADGGRCGLTGEALSADDATRICREHEPAAKG